MTLRLGLSSRLALGSCLVAGLAGLLVGVPLHEAAGELLEKSLRERAEAAAETIALTLGDAQTDPSARKALQSRLRDLAEEADLDLLTVDDANGNVVASTDGSSAIGAPDPLLAEAGVPLEALAKLDAATTPVRVDRNGRESVLAVAPIEDAVPALFVAVRAPASWSAALDQLSRRIALAVVGWMAVAAVLSAVVAQRALRPLDRLAASVRALAADRASTDLPRSGVPELDALAEDFERMRRAIAGRERWLRALAGTVAHEVRNPASAIRLQLGLLRRSIGDEASVSVRFDQLESELDELEATVSSLLAFAEGAPAHRVSTRLGPLLEKAAPACEIQAPNVDCSIDPGLVGRAVANLVRNARQAGATQVAILAVLKKDTLTITATDNGRGFPSDVAAHALEPFARGETGGSGLGLALVAAVAKAHDGEARVLAPGPGGTTVALTLANVTPLAIQR